MSRAHPVDALPAADPGVNRLDKDTRLCISLAGRPSSVGTRFHNFLYAELGLNYVYKALTTEDLPAAVAGIRALGIRGAGVSMPFKQAVIPLLDALDPSAEAIGAVNTIVNDSGRLTGYNTDVIAVRSLVPRGGTAAVQLPAPDGGSAGPARRRTAAVAGSGGMAAAVIAALLGAGYAPVDVTVAARNPATGPQLAKRYGIALVPTSGTELENLRADVLINATSLGMAGTADPAGEQELPFPPTAVPAADTVVDVVAVPPATPLIAAARAAGAATVTGDAIMALQAAEQFALYTGVRPTDEQVRRAREYSRR